MNRLRNLIAILATGYLFFFFSERLFWSFQRPDDTVADMLMTWLAYSLLAWIFLVLVRSFRVKTFPAVFITGAIFGWSLWSIFRGKRHRGGSATTPVNGKAQRKI